MHKILIPAGGLRYDLQAEKTTKVSHSSENSRVIMVSDLQVLCRIAASALAKETRYHWKVFICESQNIFLKHLWFTDPINPKLGLKRFSPGIFGPMAKYKFNMNLL